MHLVVGGPFTGVREQVSRVSLGPGETRTLEIEVEAEPRLKLRVPEGTLYLHVQAGDDSITLEPPRQDDEVLETPVPPGQPVTVFAQGRAQYRVELAPWSGTTAVDLGSARIGVAEEEPELVELRFRVRTTRGLDTAVRAEARAAGRRWLDLDPGQEGVLFRVPRGARWEARFSAEEYATLHRAGRARASSQGAELVLLPASEE